MLAQQAHALEIRNRLKNPPNAVRDDGIDLKRKVIPIAAITSAETVPIHRNDEAAMIGVPLPSAPLLVEAMNDVVAVKARMVALKKEMDILRDKYAFLEETVEDLKRPKIELVQRVVCKYYGVSKIDIVSARRTANLVRPRQMAMYLAKTLTTKALGTIGQHFGGRDHTTVLHAVRKMERLRGVNAELKAEIDHLIVKLCPHVASASNPDEARDDPAPQPAAD